MSFINNIALAYLKPVLKSFEYGKQHPQEAQYAVFKNLLRHGKNTIFGKKHDFNKIKNYEDFKKKVRIRDYNQFRNYIERVRRGEHYLLWDEKTEWFAKSSGTSSDKSKYIPITPSNLRDCHYRGFKTMLASYISTHPDSKLFLGKAITLGGSIRTDEFNKKGVFNGDLSAILLKNSPLAAEFVRTPSKDVVLMSDFERKIEKICKICSKENVTNFSGVPSWNLIMLNKILEYNNIDHITDIWPNIELFMHGGISFAPYRERYKKIIPSDNMHYLENYNASEGYFALQDDLNDAGMALTLDNGVFFEFIPMSSLSNVLAGESDEAYSVEDVEKGVQYAIVVSTNSGLWRYLLGDCVKFTSLKPHKIVITGRTQLYINAFGEELMIHNAEEALSEVCNRMNVAVADYTVAPVFMSESNKKGAHQWCVEFSKECAEKVADPAFVAEFAKELDAAICRRNSDYEAKRKNNVTMRELILTPLPESTFYKWMKKRDKVGGQNKVPRLCNDRKYIDEILKNI